MKRQIKLYNGDVTIEFDEEGHSYRWMEKDLFLPGVTSILKILAKEALIQWAANMSAADYRRQVQDWLLAEKGELTEKQLEEFEARAKTAHTRTASTAAGVGTQAHSYAEAKAKGEIPPDMETWPTEALKATEAIDKWYEDHKVEVNKDFVERIIFSREYLYAGTCDLPAKVDGIRGVYDFKACKPFYKGEVYKEYKLQLAGYAVALEEEFPSLVPIEHGGIIRLDKQSGKPTLHRIDLTFELKEAWIRTRGLYQALDRI